MSIIRIDKLEEEYKKVEKGLLEENFYVTRSLWGIKTIATHEITIMAGDCLHYNTLTITNKYLFGIRYSRVVYECAKSGGLPELTSSRFPQ